MHNKKKPWSKPKLTRLEITPEIVELFGEQLEARERAVQSRLRRAG